MSKAGPSACNRRSRSGKIGPPPVKTVCSDGGIAPPASVSHRAGGSRARVTVCCAIQAVSAAGCTCASCDIFQFGKTDVRPLAMLIRTKTGKATRSTSAALLSSIGAMARCWAARKPWLRGIALGAPLVPEVKEISARSPASGRGSSSAGPSFAMGRTCGKRHSAGRAKRSSPYAPALAKAVTPATRTAWRRPARPIAGSGKTTVAPSDHSAARLA